MYEYILEILQEIFKKSGKKPDKLFVSGKLLPNYMTKLIVRLREQGR